MIKLEDETRRYQRYDLDGALKKAYVIALKDNEFKKLINTLKVTEKIAINYTSKLENTVKELSNCSKCRSLFECKNPVNGFVSYPTLKDEKLSFNYVACKYKKKELKEHENIKTNFYEMPLEIRKARMADIDVNDTKRVKTIKWMTKFYDSFKTEKNQKGLYLHGSFGSGKTYLISALLNELSKDNTVVIVYYPELLRSLKESFETNNFSEKIDEIKRADLLLLDDIGAESVTPWNRDEILGTILQFRMDNKLPTFFTSNLTIKELEGHFGTNRSSAELIKARRIVERIKQLTDRTELVSENKRK